MTAVAVSTDLPAYRAAIAELAPRARLADPTEAGPVRVIDGRGAWWDRVSDARDAAGIVLDEPRPASEAVHRALRELPVPVVVVRRRLRADVAADAEPPLAPLHVTVDAWGPPADAATLLRDAVGWARVLGGGPLEVVARAVTPLAATLALRGAAGGASVTRAVAGGGRGGASGAGGAVTALALGPRRVEVRVDAATMTTQVAHDDERGRRIVSPRRESAERLGLRRVIEAVATGAVLADLDDLRHDDVVALS